MLRHKFLFSLLLLHIFIEVGAYGAQEPCRFVLGGISIEQAIKRVAEPFLTETAPILKESALALNPDIFLSPKFIQFIKFFAKRLSGRAGVAAPQLNVPWRVAFAKRYDKNFPKDPVFGKNILMINPTYHPSDADQVLSREGCASLKERYAVARWRTIQIHYLNSQGLPVTLTTSGRMAIVVQHEIDHLDGILIKEISEQRYIEDFGLTIPHGVSSRDQLHFLNLLKLFLSENHIFNRELILKFISDLAKGLSAETTFGFENVMLITEFIDIVRALDKGNFNDQLICSNQSFKCGGKGEE